MEADGQKKRRQLSKAAWRDISELLSFDSEVLIFDVGANEGQTVKGLRKWFPESRIFSFEPQQGPFEALSSSVADDPGVRVVQLGLSDSSGELEFAVGRNSVTGRVLVGNATSRKGESSFRIPVMRGDDFCRREGVERINVLKIDAEGHDLKVLVGFVEMLRDQRIDMVQVEAGVYKGNGTHAPFLDIWKFLDGVGYHVFGVYDQVLEFKENVSVLRRVNPVFISDHFARKNPVK